MYLCMCAKPQGDWDSAEYSAPNLGMLGKEFQVPQTTTKGFRLGVY